MNKEFNAPLTTGLIFAQNVLLEVRPERMFGLELRDVLRAGRGSRGPRVDSLLHERCWCSSSSGSGSGFLLLLFGTVAWRRVLWRRRRAHNDAVRLAVVSRVYRIEQVRELARHALPEALALRTLRARRPSILLLQQ